MLYPASSDITADNFSGAYGSANESTNQLTNKDLRQLRPSPSNELVARKRGMRQFKTFVGRFRKLLLYHVGIPICLGTLIYVNFALEVLFTASPVITSGYFGLSGAVTGIFLGFLAFLILPISFVSEFIARRYEERTVIKVSSVATSSTCLHMCPNLIILFCFHSDLWLSLDSASL